MNGLKSMILNKKVKMCAYLNKISSTSNLYLDVVRNCSEITHDNYLSKCPSASSENLDIARYACDFLLCR